MFYKEMQVDGVINETAYDQGLQSTEESPVTIDAILINLSAHEGNVIEGWIGTNRILAISDYVFDTQEESAADTPPFSSTKINRLPINEKIPGGSSFMIAIRSGGTASNIYGAYEYSPTV